MYTKPGFIVICITDQSIDVHSMTNLHFMSLACDILPFHHSNNILHNAMHFLQVACLPLLGVPCSQHCTLCTCMVVWSCLGGFFSMTLRRSSGTQSTTTTMTLSICECFWHSRNGCFIESCEIEVLNVCFTSEFSWLVLILSTLCTCHGVYMYSVFHRLYTCTCTCIYNVYSAGQWGYIWTQSIFSFES